MFYRIIDLLLIIDYCREPAGLKFTDQNAFITSDRRVRFRRKTL